jgi:hypothetical protein
MFAWEHYKYLLLNYSHIHHHLSQAQPHVTGSSIRKEAVKWPVEAYVCNEMYIVKIKLNTLITNT